MLDDELATYWILPAAFGPAATDERTFFPVSVAYLQRCFPWMKIDEVITDVGCTHADGTVRLAREIPYGSPAEEASPDCIRRAFVLQWGCQGSVLLDVQPNPLSWAASCSVPWAASPPRWEGSSWRNSSSAGITEEPWRSPGHGYWLGLVIRVAVWSGVDDHRSLGDLGMGVRL